MQYTYLTRNSDAEYVSNSYNTKIRKTNDLTFLQMNKILGHVTNDDIGQYNMKCC